MYTLCTLVVDTAPVLTYCLGLQITSQSRQSGPESTSYAPPSRGQYLENERKGLLGRGRVWGEFCYAMWNCLGLPAALLGRQLEA